MQHQHQGSSSQAVEEQAQTQNAPLLQPLRTHPTPNWDPATVKVTLNLALDGCIVPSTAPPGARVDYSHLVCVRVRVCQQSLAGVKQSTPQQLAAWLAQAGVVDTFCYLIGLPVAWSVLASASRQPAQYYHTLLH